MNWPPECGWKVFLCNQKYPSNRSAEPYSSTKLIQGTSGFCVSTSSHNESKAEIAEGQRLIVRLEVGQMVGTNGREVDDTSLLEPGGNKAKRAVYVPGRVRVVKLVFTLGTTQACNGGQPASVVGLRQSDAMAGLTSDG